MADWLAAVRETLKPLGIEKHDVRKMIAEWYYTGNCNDLKAPSSDCELCGHRNIRYEFEIENRHNGNSLLVGSECITKFDISGISEAGEFIDARETAKRVHRDRSKMITDAKRRRAINALIQLVTVDGEFDFPIEALLDDFQDKGGFSPKQLALVIWRLRKSGIEHQVSDFKLRLTKSHFKTALREMELWKVQQIWPAMSPSQKRWYEEKIGFSV